MKLSERIARSREILTRGGFQKNDYGDITKPEGPHCATGAVYASFPHDEFLGTGPMQIFTHLTKAARKLFPDRDDWFGHDIVSVNDHELTTMDDIVRIFDEAERVAIMLENPQDHQPTEDTPIVPSRANTPNPFTVEEEPLFKLKRGPRTYYDL